MTATQVAFLLVVIAVGPGFGVCGGVACQSSTLRSRRAFLVATLASWFALGISGAVAALCHPRYPVEGPPEHVAMLYVAPCLVVGVGAVLLLMRFAPPRTDALIRPGDLERDQRRGKRLLVAGTLLSVVLFVGIQYVLVMPMHRALPWGASNVRESYWGDGFLPDYSYCLGTSPRERVRQLREQAWTHAAHPGARVRRRQDMAVEDGRIYSGIDVIIGALATCFAVMARRIRRNSTTQAVIAASGYGVILFGGLMLLGAAFSISMVMNLAMLIFIGGLLGSMSEMA